MHCILCILFYVLYSMLLKLVTDGPTDRRTDIVTYRAAIAAKKPNTDQLLKSLCGCWANTLLIPYKANCIFTGK